jgi:tRNA(fMet)-specific endonuclease VapC
MKSVSPLSSLQNYDLEQRKEILLSNQVETILPAMLVVPFDVPIDREHAKLRQLLESSGNSIGPNDLLIAAQARANG